MNDLEILIAVREKLLPPEHWTKQAAARDERGNPVSMYSPNAFCFCLIGAVRNVHYSNYGNRGSGINVPDTMKKLFQDRNYSTAARFNDADTTTHADVIALLDEAIELERGT